ncbi:hypothetical protein BDR07DRAFT_693010 [Suillus spraguei]|nr:hypothetical protein BDR07DRAFT_693010 [Suillus spraguei]
MTTTRMADVLIAFLCQAVFLNTPQHLASAAPLQPVSSTLRKKHVTANPITAASSTGYWGIHQSITCGSTTILSSTASIVDTGTTFLFIASDACDRYRVATVDR